MNRSHLWKFLLVIFILAWALYELYPPSGYNLINYFESHAVNVDSNFVAIVEKARDLEEEFPTRNFANLEKAIGTNEISGYFPTISTTKTEKEDLTIQILHELQQQASGNIKLGLDLKGGTSFLVEMDTNNIPEADERTRMLSQAVQVLRKRVDALGVAEPNIQPVGSDRIMIALPGLTAAENETARKQIQRAAFLEFRIVHPESERFVQEGIPAPGYEVLQMTDETRTGETIVRKLLVKKKPELGLTGKYIKRAFVTRGQVVNEPLISFELDSEGANKFAKITKQNLGERLAIVLDGELYSAPVIQSEILKGRGQISGDFDIQEAIELANVLENPLEAPVKIVEERRVDPSLGKDSIRSGIKASIIGALFVVLFMVVYYLRSGLIANVALLMNVVVLLGVFCAIDATLTLPGIAGIVLTIGMAVDANVLIFERIREEAAAGKSLRGSIAAGYGKAFSTILDTNLTTMITSVILIYKGTGPVKGFGVTLSIGIAVSMFTALVVTRLIFDFLVAKNWLKSIKMLSILKKTKLDFLRWALPAFVASWALIVVGTSYGAFRGHDVLGVDFVGGDSLALSFQEKPAVQEIRDAVTGLNVGDTFIQYERDLSTGKEQLRINSEFDTADEVESALKEEFPQAQFQRLALDKVGPTVGAEILESALVACMLAVLAILVYVAVRYEFSFAIGAVIALFHDVLMTVGLFCLSGREFSAPIVAAILTIIGFSINDTIVIFDRIREDLQLGIRGTFKEIMNRAINQTLRRTIVTSGTTFLATLSLYVFGGGVINDFAFTFMVGILTGTFSSVFIASPVVLWWHKGKRPKMATQQVVAEPAAAANAK